MSGKVDHIEIRGARVHNLKNVSLDLPLKKLICFAGPSGSGKTSLAFHTLMAESKRRFLNSFPNSLKFFSDRPSAVDVDRIFPVLPVFGLPQINPVMGSRSVVSDVMRLTDSLQALFYSYSKEYCPSHKILLSTITVDEQLKQLLKGKLEGVFHVLIHKDEYGGIMGEVIPSRSFDGKSIRSFEKEDDWWELLRFKADKMENLEAKWKELKLHHYRGSLQLFKEGQKKLTPYTYHNDKKCPECDFHSHPVASVSAFSPYNALGACQTCNGFGANLIYDDEKLIEKDLSVNEGGLRLLRYAPFEFFYLELIKILKKKKISLDEPIKKLPKEFTKLVYEGEGKYEGYTELLSYLDSKRYKPSVRVYIRNLQKEELCDVCEGTRLNQDINHYWVQINKNQTALSELMKLTIAEGLDVFKKAHSTISHEEQLYRDTEEKLELAFKLGLGHLPLLRKAKSLSAGEYQRLLLIKYLSFKGTDALFVLDEPSLGLGEKEQEQVLQGIRKIIDQGNTVIVIDHSKQIQSACDELVVMGPESGKNGGELIYQGKPKKFLDSQVIDKSDLNLKKFKSPKEQYIEVLNPEIYGKKYPDFKIPLGEMTWVNGASGTGKTSCLIKIMANTISKKIEGDYLVDEKFLVKQVKGIQHLQNIVVVASNLNRFTSRSTVGTITEFAPAIRKHFLKLPVSKSMGLKEGHFSSNSELGMCPRCEGKGHLVIEMQYLEDIILECEDCRGMKIKPLYANISDGTMTVAEAYNLPLSQVLGKIQLTPKYRRIWEYLKILNIDYLSLDRQVNSLSGGEKQRIYLLSKLLKSLENTMIIFENLSFGLSEQDLVRMGKFLRDLLPLGNTIVVIDPHPFFKELASKELHFTEKAINLKNLN
ncbi:MAG: ATP-binding cassette domain-containing protein [Bacteriovoracaceae bacterium]